MSRVHTLHLTRRLVTLDEELLGLVVVGGVGVLIRVDQGARPNLIAACEARDDVLLHRHSLLAHDDDILVVEEV